MYHRAGQLILRHRQQLAHILLRHLLPVRQVNGGILPQAYVKQATWEEQEHMYLLHHAQAVNGGILLQAHVKQAPRGVGNTLCRLVLRE